MNILIKMISGWSALMKSIIVYLLIGILWRYLEIWMVGYPNPNTADTIISLIMFYFIYRYYREKQNS